MHSSISRTMRLCRYFLSVGSLLSLKKITKLECKAAGFTPMFDYLMYVVTIRKGFESDKNTAFFKIATRIGSKRRKFHEHDFTTFYL